MRDKLINSLEFIDVGLQSTLSKEGSNGFCLG